MIDDNDTPASTRDAEAYGQAALLLVESLIHGLIARSFITVSEAVEIVRTAAEVKEDMAADRQEGPAGTAKSLHLLGAITASLMTDMPPP